MEFGGEVGVVELALRVLVALDGTTTESINDFFGSFCETTKALAGLTTSATAAGADTQ